MIRKITNYFLRSLPVIALVAVWTLLVFANFTPGTLLSGWDNLHPEFDFFLNIKRSIFAAWQEYQGLGLLGGMGHAADLPRQVLLWGLSYLLPMSLLRYVWVFTMLLIGPLGVYYLVDKVVLGGSGSFSRKTAAFVAAMFYLLNLATVQYFFVPFETFVSFYGFLPWLLAVSLNYLNTGTKKDLIKIFVLHLIASTSFYVQTLFVVYILVLSVFILGYLLRKRLGGVLRVLILALVIFASNAYWLLPVVYFTFTNANVLVEAKQNIISTPETFYMNAARGDVQDIALLKGYWFDYYDVKPDGSFDYLFKDWINHVNSGSVQDWGIVIFAASLFGTLAGIIRRKKWTFSIAAITLLSYFMLATTNPPFGALFESISESVPFFGEIFRNVFTKWSMVAALSYSLGLAFLISLIASVFRRRGKSIITLFSVAVLLFGMYRVVQPVLDGKLISQSMKVELPEEYSQLFGYFEKEDESKRIAFLPIHTPWGWQFNSWGYRGSGYLWYGIDQPILHRSFDVWSPQNETFYNQASFAIYEKDPKMLERTLEKYNVSFLFLDDSIINPGGSEELLFKEELKSLLNTSQNIKLVQKYEFLSIYETNLAKDEPVFAPQAYNQIDADLTYASIDPVYEDRETYQIEGEGVTYPFVNFDTRKAPDLIVKDGVIEFKTKPLTFSSRKYLATGELDSPLFGVPETMVDGSKRLVTRIPVNQIVSEDFSQERGLAEAKNCDVKEAGVVYKDNNGGRLLYRAEGGGVSCDYFVYENLSYDTGYILHIKGENKEGRGLKVYLQNRETKRMDLEELLPKVEFYEYYFILPKDIEGEGYTLNLETRSFGDVASENTVEEIEFIPFPHTWLSDIKLVPQDYGLIRNDVAITSLDKVNPTRYEVTTFSPNGGLIVLDQSYESGWRAYKVEGRLEKILPWFGEEVGHTKVNDWANGWIVPEGDSDIAIVFLPQYLEYFGFGLLFFAFLALILKQSNRVDFRLK